MSITTTALPEQGQLVEVRHRRYVTTDINESAIPANPLSPHDGNPQHLVTLTSVEDDALGEELQVIWEIEPGAQICEDMVLPALTGFDEPRQLDAFLNAVLWGAVSSADIRALQAPFRSGIDIEDYQLDPLVRALEMPRVNLLIADDVGLGKTIEAGLVIQELLIRHRARTILVVCPAALQIQWRDQMRDKFGLEFRIVDGELLRQLRRTRGIHANPWTHFPRLITSVDLLKRDRLLRLFREVLPSGDETPYPRRFDMLVVDEAHNIAPSGRGQYAVDSLRTTAIRMLSKHFEHKLFLTATPHNGFPESFSALLELLDNQRFARGVAPDRELLAAAMVRRLKSELPPNWDGTPRFPKRKLEPLEVSYSDEERRAHHLLQEYTRLRQQHISDPLERTATEFVLTLLKKRLFSSPAAFAGTLSKHEESFKETAQASSLQGRKPHAGILRAMVDEVEEEYADDTAYQQATESALHSATRVLSKLTVEEQHLLGELHQWANRAAARPDSKARTLIEWLKTHFRPGGQWSAERVIVFTEYRDTQKWLQGLLATEGLTQSEHLQTLYGGMDAQDRETIKAAFQASPAQSPVRILLATDAASEGIDLQLHCHRLIHYEIPWNPNRMEQRNGRIDRHGQHENPLIYHFVPRGYLEQLIPQDIPTGKLEGDLEFLMCAVRKIEQIREDLGKVGPVIAEQVTEAMLGRRRRLETADAERSAAPVRSLLKFERDLQAHIRSLRDRLAETTQILGVTPENVQAMVEIALQLAGQPPLQEAQVQGLWPDPEGKLQRCPVFHLPPLHGSWALCAEGLAHPHSGEIRPIVFDHNLARGRDDVVLVHLNHRLVQMSMRLLRAEVWSSISTRNLHRVVARIVTDSTLKTPAVIAHARLVVVGGNRHRLHEEIISAGGFIREGRFQRMNVGEVRATLQSATSLQPSEPMKLRLAKLWPSIAPGLLQALEARKTERMTGLMTLIRERESKETGNITSVLQELEQAIRSELVAPAVVQLELFSTSESEQYNRNISALQFRLAQIPREIEQETAAIRMRYTDPQPRMFPVAVTFLVPRNLA